MAPAEPMLVRSHCTAPPHSPPPRVHESSSNAKGQGTCVSGDKGCGQSKWGVGVGGRGAAAKLPVQAGAGGPQDSVVRFALQNLKPRSPGPRGDGVL